LEKHSLDHANKLVTVLPSMTRDSMRSSPDNDRHGLTAAPVKHRWRKPQEQFRDTKADQTNFDFAVTYRACR
jgi:hypothetical protein